MDGMFCVSTAEYLYLLDQENGILFRIGRSKMERRRVWATPKAHISRLSVLFGKREMARYGLN